MKNETAKAGAHFLAQLLNDPQVLEALMPVFAQIGARIADQTAQRINERHSDAIMPAKDAVVPVSDCLAKLGVSMPTFKKHFFKYRETQNCRPTSKCRPSPEIRTGQRVCESHRGRAH